MAGIFFNLFKKEIQDPKIQENFRRIEEFITKSPLLKSDLKFFEVETVSAVANLRFKHNLGYLPKDLIQLSVRPSSVVVTWNYDLFDRDFIDLSTTGAASVRFFLGTYNEATQ